LIDDWTNDNDRLRGRAKNTSSSKTTTTTTTATTNHHHHDATSLSLYSKRGNYLSRDLLYNKNSSIQTFQLLLSQMSDQAVELIRPFEWLTSPHSLRDLIERETSSNGTTPTTAPKKALHVGSGSSTLGEFLVEELGFHVVNCDRDGETLEGMERRWEQLHHSDEDDLKTRLEFCVVDFCSDPIPYPTESFDVVLDKSTLDCTLCSDRSAARLLVEVYRALAPIGVYILISFHPIEMLRPLLENLPGAVWDVTSTTMERQLEDFLGGNKNVSYTTHDSKQPENLLNVLIARKRRNGNNPTISIPELDFAQVMEHVHRTNDDWFQKQHPLITRARHETLEKEFGGRAMPLSEAYAVLFTEAEREHLEYDAFLEDWDVFLSKHEELPRDSISFQTAVVFLEEMQ
jgi:SAM-dependent methyltransferase